MRKRLPGAFLVATGLWALASGVIYTKQDALIYPNGGPAYTDCADMQRLGGVAESKTYSGQELRYVIFRGERAKSTVLFFHGNGGTVCYRTLHAEHLRSPAWDLVMLEYPGYGGDSAPPSQERILPNALAAYDAFRAEHPGRSILVIGKSLGSGPATYLASERPVAGLIVQTPYTSITDLASWRFKVLPISLLNRHPFPAKEWAAKVGCPVLVVHGTSDSVIPFSMGRRQAANFKSLASFEAFEGAGHGDMPYREPDRYWGLFRSILIRLS